jgi:hypothetical protein
VSELSVCMCVCVCVCVRDMESIRDTMDKHCERKREKGFLARSSHTQSNLGVLQSFSEYSGAGRLGTEKAFKSDAVKGGLCNFFVRLRKNCREPFCKIIDCDSISKSFAVCVERVVCRPPLRVGQRDRERQ